MTAAALHRQLTACSDDAPSWRHGTDRPQRALQLPLVLHASPEVPSPTFLVIQPPYLPLPSNYDRAIALLASSSPTKTLNFSGGPFAVNNFLMLTRLACPAKRRALISKSLQVLSPDRAVSLESSKELGQCYRTCRNRRYACAGWPLQLSSIVGASTDAPSWRQTAGGVMTQSSRETAAPESRIYTPAACRTTSGADRTTSWTCNVNHESSVANVELTQKERQP
ncbi:hypothetical protein C7974DRAFT_187058 [Boeremia exigua]|uniref:uncharacterized protein n=1 Tax=Boeremia exigua TaxID=749465 RepID=UPI001E8EC9FB|nr:uncharacterized protein C7974DRAFT_187058 [Boeremia exigua]KAH6629475.1 hypothetical protein C7974DRAFT_187058 [Boeremia exigua]